MLVIHRDQQQLVMERQAACSSSSSSSRCQRRGPQTHISNSTNNLMPKTANKLEALVLINPDQMYHKTSSKLRLQVWSGPGEKIQ